MSCTRTTQWLTTTLRRQRWAWGLQGYQIPYFSRDFTSTEDPTTGFVQVQDFRSWQVERSMMGSLTYPVSPVMRFESTLGYRNIDFSGEVETLTYDPNGFLIDDRTTPSLDEALPSLSLYTSSLAAVYDNSIFGGTSPVAGQRYRLEVDPMLGDLRFTTVLGDLRRYFRLVGPFTLATRAMHIGRYGRDSESNRIGALFVGYPWLIRGYDSESFTAQECQTGDCNEFQRLFGSRIAVGNVELRLPLLGAIGVVRSPQIPPVEIAGFYDAGAAWTNLQRRASGRPGPA
jgi:outer membrane protein assembly factor BamA